MIETWLLKGRLEGSGLYFTGQIYKRYTFTRFLNTNNHHIRIINRGRGREKGRFEQISITK